ncbi:nucleolar protein 16 [Aspergillus melleus]|uniref:nucleolar protein 16 n=1 Tax=Aspergillus melleus TaxID=138277 RepID=UPI001E8D6575|nr:Nucleolar protein 16 [Aspergillus melleus]KAH8433034.1 Nucleolar protein 16 [Aspergillus melleus]
MTNIRQARKLRSGLSKNRPKRGNILKSGKKKVNVLGNAIIAENWDRKLTLTQNYRRLGLTHRLNAPAGGAEKRPNKDGGIDVAPENSLHIKGSSEATAKQLGLGEVEVERDPETGNIIRVVSKKRDNPLNDPLNDLSDNEQDAYGAPKTDIVKQLERQAAQEGEDVKTKKPRHQSSREAEWIQRLVDRHGDDIAAMFRDRKLNPMQQSEGDIRRRIKKWKKSQE